MTLASAGGGAATMGALVQKMPNAAGSRRRMASLSRSDPVLRFVRSRQRFVRWSQARAACQTAGGEEGQRLGRARAGAEVEASSPTMG